MPQSLLIAEDDPFMSKMYRLNLQEEGFEVSIAADGQETIAAIEKQKPNLLLLDLLMPNVDGFEVLKHIKTKGYTFPIIILSNLSQEIDQQKCKELGVKDYFVKSEMDLADLSSTVKKYLR